jgi:transketolase
MKKLKRAIVEAAVYAGEGHIPSAFSILDILWVIYDKILRIDPKDYRHPERDRFVLSKGHASLGLYAVLAEKGFFRLEELKNFGEYDSMLGGHPDMNKVPGAEASTGSLGHGFPMATGIALGLRIRKSDARVYTIIGDGECNEGTIWESALIAAHHKLSNLTCIVDHNHSTDRALGIESLTDKFSAFGWKCIEIDGHDTDEIEAALREPSDKPKAVIANTVKGNGIKMMENNPAWHHKAPTEEELESLLKELL